MNTSLFEGILPVNFHDVKRSPPIGFSISEILIEPRILIKRNGNLFSASVAGCIKKNGQLNYIPVAREGANYVIDGKQLKPLPKDCTEFFKNKLKGINPDSITFPDVIGLMHRSSDEMPVVVDDLVPNFADSLAKNVVLEEAIPGLNATLYLYQNSGIAWMNRCLNLTGGLILADEMGLGKTLQIIGLLLLHPPKNDNPVLIICPTTLIANWAREISKFAPGISPLMIHRGANRARIFSEFLSANVVITTYDTVISDISIIRSVIWSFIIIDEAQAIKNPTSQRRESLVQIPRQYAIAVTGTPIENSLKDIWSLADFVIPGILGTEKDFDILFPDGGHGPTNLSTIIEPFILKRKLADVATDLPEKINCDIPIEIGDALSVQYEHIRRLTLSKYPKAGALVATGQLQLFCAHPWLFSTNPLSETWEEDVTFDPSPFSPLLTPKMELTISLIEEAFKCGRKVLVFSIFNKIGDLIKEAGRDLPAAFWGSINGSTEQSRRQEIVDEFSAFNGPGILILNPKAAGTGLNITAATVVIHYTPVWNPAIEAQASARAHRRGQVYPVTIYRLYYENTVERVMLDRTLLKAGLAEDTVVITSDRNRTDVAKAISISPILNLHS